MKKLALLAAAAAVLATLVALPGLVESRFNRVLARQRPPASERARALHAKLLVADLHADSLLWGRDLLRRARRGHVDVPRLVEGSVAVQAFTVVTKVPRGINIERNDDSTDLVLPLALAGRWPPATWTSLTERALYQARRLHAMAAASAGRLTVLKSADDLAAYLERRRRDPAITAAFLGIEGAQALDGDLERLDTLWDAGFRMLGLSHFYDTDLAGSAHGIGRGGLTAKGRALVRRMDDKRMLLDLAHASPAAIADALAIARRPVVVSHTGVRATCDNVRNLSDDQLRGIARTGGVVGIGYWETAVCGADGRAVARAMRHAVSVAGIEHVGLGSDFDGAVATPFDTSGLLEVTDALLAEGFAEEDVALVMGGNVLRLLAQALP